MTAKDNLKQLLKALGDFRVLAKPNNGLLHNVCNEKNNQSLRGVYDEAIQFCKNSFKRVCSKLDLFRNINTAPEQTCRLTK